MGLDEAGLNDDRDMLQEMRLVLKLHLEPGIDNFVPAAAQVFQMATENGAHTTRFPCLKRCSIGTKPPATRDALVTG
jgi:5-methylthioadenosine/S-adenosylhomocysteine deaminase